MALLETGRVCVTKTGRHAGETVVFLELKENNVAVVASNKRKRKVNVRHLIPVNKVLEKSQLSSLESLPEKFEKKEKSKRRKKIGE